MSARVLAALLLSAATRYGSPPPGILSPSLLVSPCAIDGEFHASTATTIYIYDSVNMTEQVNTAPQCASLLTLRVDTAPLCAPPHVVAFNTSHEVTPPLWQELVPAAPTQLVVESISPLVHSKYRDRGRPPDPASSFSLNTSMVERFLLELLIYICFENLRSPLSIYGAIALVCRLWLGISATLLWFITYCANIVRFVVACTLLMALRAVLATYAAVSVALGLIGCAIGFTCSLLCCTLYCAVKLTRVLGDSIAGIALYMCGLAVAQSAYALAHAAVAVSRVTLSLVYAATIPMRRISMAMRERLIDLNGGDPICLPICKKRRRQACPSARAEALALLAHHATPVPIVARVARLASSAATHAARSCYFIALTCSLSQLPAVDEYIRAFGMRVGHSAHAMAITLACVRHWALLVAADGYLMATPLISVATPVHDCICHLFVRTAKLAATRNVTALFALWVLSFPVGTYAPSDSYASKAAPMFSGQRVDFLKWYMLFSGYVAYKLVKAAPLLSGRARPADAPAPLRGRATPRPPNPPAPALGADGATVTNQTIINQRAAAIAAWDATPEIVLNQAAIDAADAACETWDDLNTQLYGLLTQALPESLVTSIFNTHINDGVNALAHLRTQFDAHAGDGGDHAAHLALLQRAVIDTRADVSEDDLRRQFDMMTTEAAAITRTGHAPPDESTMIAFYDNALPIAYSTMRQHARRAKHATLLAHHSDIAAQVRAEVNARRPAPNAFQGQWQQNGGGANDGAGQRGMQEKLCLRCGEPGHTRKNCKKRKAKCSSCSGDHLAAFCGRGPGARRSQLSEVLCKIIDSDTERAGKAPASPPATYAAAASGAGTSAAHTQQANQQVAAPAAPVQAASTANVPFPAGGIAPPPGISAGTSDITATAHAAAAHAASMQPNPQAAAAAYVAALQGLGFGFMGHLDLHACAGSAPSARVREVLRTSPPPSPSVPDHAFVDSMATFWIVDSIQKLHSVTRLRPGFTINTANGTVPVLAVGTALVYLRVGSEWQCYEIPNVLVLENCGATLYSTRVMRECHGFDHRIDQSTISVPGAADVSITDTGSAYEIPVAFVPAGTPRPRVVHVPSRRPAHALLADGAAFPDGVAGTSQAVLHQRLGFPYDEQWRRVPSATVGHGLPPNATVSTDLPVRDAIARGRARAVPFLRKHIQDVSQPPPAAVFYMDFAGPLIASVLHRFTCYACAVDAGSGFGRMFPAHHMTGVVATASLETFTAEVGSLMGFHGNFKPLVVRSDQGSAFVSHHFREFLSARQIHQSLACTYTPQQNAHAERFFGVAFSTARVLLAAANLPPTFHPFALQTAVWIHNRLPRPSRGDVSPYFTLTRRQPSLQDLYTFGCLCAVVVPSAHRHGDRHFADRGEHGLYLGPSEVSPGHVVYLLSSRKVQGVAKLSKVWEDNYPGVSGDRYVWFPEPLPGLPEPAVPPLGGAPAPPPVDYVSSNDPSGSPRQQPPSPQSPAPAPSPSLMPTPRAPPSVRPPPPPRFDGAASPGGAVAPDVTSGGADVTSGGAHRSRVQSETRSDLGSYWQPDGSRPRRRHSSTSNAEVAHALSIWAMLSACTLSAAPLSAAPARPAFAYAGLIGSMDRHFDDWSSPTFSFSNAAVAAADAFAVTITSDMGELSVPKSYRHAMRSAQADYWREAIAKELGGLVALHTWDLKLASEMPAGANLMNCHYVFTVKRKADGSIEKFKARLVADGNTQKFGVDFDRIFSTVVKVTTIRLVLIIAAARGYNLTSIDIRQAYLQAELKEDLFMRPPPDVRPFDSQHRPLVCKLRRSLYGLKQAGREWGMLFSAFLINWGFKRSTIDHCLYTYVLGSSILWCLIYVDDGLLCDNSPELRDRFVAALSKRFPTEDKGELTWILNVAISRDRVARSISLSQELYVNDLLEKFGSYIESSLTRKFDCPMDEGTVLSSDDQPVIGSAEYEAMAVRRDAYMSMVGGFLWLANMTMWFLAFPAGQLARFLTNPGPSHFVAAVRVLIYLRQHGAKPLVYRPNCARGLDTFVDSDWAVKFSVSGCLVFYHGCLFHWFSKMQKSVSLSSAEAEYFGAMMTGRELVFVRDLLVEIGIILDAASVIWSDSKSAVNMAFDPVAFKNTKHILRDAEFLRDLVAREVLILKHLPGKIMLADLLTKAVARVTYVALMRLYDAYAEDGIACPPT